VYTQISAFIFCTSNLTITVGWLDWSELFALLSFCCHGYCYVVDDSFLRFVPFHKICSVATPAWGLGWFRKFQVLKLKNMLHFFAFRRDDEL
jgi:hypothetical protein